MAFPTEHILRLPRIDTKSKHTLINVAKAGRNDLDIKLIGTDKKTLFATTINEADINSPQERGFTLEEWKTILTFALWNRRPEGPLPNILQDLETVSAISGSTLTIAFRKKVGGIVQRLGSIEMKEIPPPDNFDSLDWVDTAVAISDNLRDQLETLQASVDSQQNQIAKLATELDMLIRAKKEHENELLGKFAALLNTKKLKIRDQQRLLNGAKIDRSTAEEVSRTRKAGLSRGTRGTKRKANGAAPVSPEGGDEDGSEADHEDLRRHQETPEPSDEDAETEPETETDDDDEDGVALKESAAAATSQQISQAQRAAEGMDIDDVGEAPPPRELPFQPKHAKEPRPPLASDASEDDDDETDDDEL